MWPLRPPLSVEANPDSLYFATVSKGSPVTWRLPAHPRQPPFLRPQFIRYNVARRLATMSGLPRAAVADRRLT